MIFVADFCVSCYSQGEETCSSTDTSDKPDSTGPGETVTSVTY